MNLETTTQAAGRRAKKTELRSRRSRWKASTGSSAGDLRRVEPTTLSVLCQHLGQNDQKMKNDRFLLTILTSHLPRSGVLFANVNYSFAATQNPKGFKGFLLVAYKMITFYNHLLIYIPKI